LIGKPGEISIAAAGIKDIPWAILPESGQGRAIARMKI
jgi:hypothetical protein